MQRVFISLLSFLVVLLLNTEVFSLPVKHSIIYVSTNGDDIFEGSQLRPVKSLRRALDLVLLFRKDSAATVEILLRGGRYFLPAGAAIDSVYSSPQTTLIIQNYQNEQVIFSGGVQIVGFKKVRDSTLLSRLDPAARDSLYSLDLNTQLHIDNPTFPRYGFGRNIIPTSPMVYTSSSSLPMARWPNTGWVKTSLGTDSMHNAGFVFQSERIKRWGGESNVMVHGFWKYNWADSHENIRSIDTARHIIFTESPHGVYGYSANRRFYVFNIFEELDSNGEWFIDKQTGMLYVWTNSTKLLDSLFLSVCAEPLLKLAGCSNVTIKGIDFEATRGVGVQLIGTKNCVIDGCTFMNIGMHGITVGETGGNIAGAVYGNTMYDGNAGHDNTIAHCAFKDIGHTAVILGGGNRHTLESGRNKVVQSTISRCNTISLTMCGGIFMYGVGNEISDCSISDLPHTAIFFWGNDHKIFHNYISNVCLETGDAGALYVGRDWTQRGTTISHNVISGIISKKIDESYSEVAGVYLDDLAGGTEIANNLFSNVGIGVKIGGGRENFVQRNIFYQCDVSIACDDRGATWANNIITGKDSLLIKRLQSVKPESLPYSKKYPLLSTLLKDHPELPKYNRVEDNAIVNSAFLNSSKSVDTLVSTKNNYIIKKFTKYSPAGANFGLDSVFNLISFEPLMFSTEQNR